MKLINEKIYKCGNEKCGFPLFKKKVFEVLFDNGGRETKEEYYFLRYKDGRTFEQKFTINFKGEGDFSIECPKCHLPSAFRLIKITDSNKKADETSKIDKIFDKSS